MNIEDKFDKSIRILKRHGISFEVNNNCIHIIISRRNNEFIDLWPETGLWILSKDKSRSHGVYNLISFVKGDSI